LLALIAGEEQVTEVERDENGRFKKGISGNPKGRAPRETEQYFVDLFRSSVSDTDFKAVVDALVKAAKRGNTAAIKIILDYLMGAPKQRTELTGAGGEAIKQELTINDGTILRKLFPELAGSGTTSAPETAD
jgi:hypothetical protein